MSEHREQALEDAVVTGAGIIDRKRLILVVQADRRSQEEIEAGPPMPSRVINHNWEMDRWGWHEFPDGGFQGGMVAAGKANGVLQALVTNHFAQIITYDFKRGDTQYEDVIDKSVIVGCDRVRFIGEHFYAVSACRSVARRLGPNRWEHISQEIEDRLLQELRIRRTGGASEYGFDSIDGFSEHDIYACGGRGDIWHFDGRQWTQSDPGTEWMMRDLCCAGDGLVYISGASGQLLAGHKDRGWWELENGEGRSVGDINELAWFQDHLYAATDYMLYRLEDGRLQPVKFQGEYRPSSFGWVSARDGMLLAAGPTGAAVYDGKSWRIIFGGVSQVEAARRHAAVKVVSDLGRIRDLLLDIRGAKDRDR